jgi:DNA repair protein RadC
VPEEDAKPHYLGHRQRLRERFMASDDHRGMPDYEILELLLFGANPRGDVKPLAKALVARFGTLGGVLAAEPARLREVAGCGETAIALLKVVREAGIRLARGAMMGRPGLGDWEKVLDYCRARLGHEATERFHILFLDAKNQLIADEEQQRGTVNHTPVYPREVVRRALELQASALIMVHNHPSGDPEPSRADIEMTRQVELAARAVGLKLHDHLVIGRGERYASFRSRQLL